MQKSHIDLGFFYPEIAFFERNVCELTFITGPRLKQTKSQNTRLPGHPFF